MLSRALILATVMLWIGCYAAGRALAQENLEAGKSPSQIFGGTCTACHKSPRGLLKTVPAGSLPSFLRQHYTTSPQMATVLAAYLVSNGANDPHAAAAAAPKGAKEGPRETKQEAKPANATIEPDRNGRRQHATVAPQEGAVPSGERPPETQPPAQATGRWSAKQKLTKRGKPAEDAAKEEPAATIEPPKSDTTNGETIKDETAKVEPGKPEGSPPAPDSPSQSAKMEPPKETPVLRPDPVPPVTPAPSASPAAAPPASAPVTSAPPAASAAAGANSNSGSEPMPVMALPSAPPAVTASAPSLPPVPPAGPPVPPISK
jgi:hypothetical protein